MAPIHRRVLFVWGIAIAVLVLITIPFPPEDRPAATALDWLAWGVPYAAFFAAFWLTDRVPLRACLACETACVLWILSTRPALGLEGALFASIAFQLGAEPRRALALVWIGAQAAAMFAILDGRFGIDHALSVVVVYLPFQLLAWFTSRVLARESAAREQLARVNAELLATRELLAAHSRAAERLRISQELHDVFGHRLAALGLNLEAATRVAPGERAHFVATAHDGVKGLLADVREVVTNLRRSEPVDVAEALRRIVRDVPRPAIDLACPESLAVADPEAAHVVVRCAQELVTNSVKHSGGERLRLELRALPTGIEMIASDDGRGAAELCEGNGLRGMRERVAARGGTLSVETAARAGFRVRVFVPGGAA